MEKNAKALYLMGILQDDRSSDVTKRGMKRLRYRYTFKFSGKLVCRRTFHVCYDIGRSALKGIMSHMLEHGVVPKNHGNKGRRPKHALCFDDVQRVVAYLLNCAEREGIPLPAAPRGRDNIPQIYLPASTTKLDLFKDYQQNCASNIRIVKLTAFKSIWSSCVPNIRIASPRDDVCAICENLRKRVVDAIEEDEQLEATDAYGDHIRQGKRVCLLINNLYLYYAPQNLF
ncbi:hypothetical protein DPMN_101048 [Dreissena polymorpha]|uniref:Uncharacterized protein n=1 Tax=Dreissena polymorpha TaxID=45954 RepID=A0A9D4LID9_DREPO|nr:hypothetical protein DPMN_101048 [Dreissena polymorpha]